VDFLSPLQGVLVLPVFIVAAALRLSANYFYKKISPPRFYQSNTIDNVDLWNSSPDEKLFFLFLCLASGAMGVAFSVIVMMW